MSDSSNKEQKISNALGSTRMIPIAKLNLGSPLSWLNLQELRNRLISTGGRPSDPCWDTRRLIPFRRKVWDYLADEAKSISTRDRKVGPAQLAAMIIENYLRPSIDLSSSDKTESIGAP